MQLILIVQIVLLFAGLGIVGVAVAMQSHAAVAGGHLFLFLAGVVHLWRIVARRAQCWSLCDVQGASLLISYFGGSAMTLTLSRSGIIGALDLPQLAMMLNASVYIVFFAVCLYLLGRIEAPFWRRLFRQDLGAGWPAWLPLAFLVLGGLAASQLASGAISLQGVAAVDETRVPVFTAFVVALSWPVAGICGWVLGSSLLRRRPLYLATALALIPVALVLNLAHGRRVILFQALIFLACFAWSRGRGFSGRQLVTMGLVALPVIYALWVVFLALRLEGYQNASPVDRQRDIFARLNGAVELMDKRWDRVAQRQEAEVVDRVFVLGYLVDLMQNARLTNRFDGRVLATEAVTAVPRFILPRKDNILRSLNADEAAIGQRYNIGTTDRPTSIVTVAFVDFRWLGPVLYSVLTLLIGVAAATMAGIVNLNFFSVYAICFVFLRALGTESAFFTDKLEMLRTLAVLFVLLCLYRLCRRVFAEPYMVRRRVWR